MAEVVSAGLPSGRRPIPNSFPNANILFVSVRLDHPPHLCRCLSAMSHPRSKASPFPSKPLCVAPMGPAGGASECYTIRYIFHLERQCLRFPEPPRFHFCWSATLGCMGSLGASPTFGRAKFGNWYFFGNRESTIRYIFEPSEGAPCSRVTNSMVVFHACLLTEGSSIDLSDTDWRTPCIPCPLQPVVL